MLRYWGGALVVMLGDVGFDRTSLTKIVSSLLFVTVQIRLDRSNRRFCWWKLGDDTSLQRLISNYPTWLMIVCAYEPSLPEAHGHRTSRLCPSKRNCLRRARVVVRSSRLLFAPTRLPPFSYIGVSTSVAVSAKSRHHPRLSGTIVA